MENGSRTPSTVVIVFLIYFPKRCDERQILISGSRAREATKATGRFKNKRKRNKKMTFDILLVNSSSASTVTSYDKGIEQRGRAGAVRGDHRSLPRTFIIMARRCRQEPRPPSPLSRETVFRWDYPSTFEFIWNCNGSAHFPGRKIKLEKHKKHHGTPRASKPSHRIRVTAYESTRLTKKKEWVRLTQKLNELLSAYLF